MIALIAKDVVSDKKFPEDLTVLVAAWVKSAHYAGNGMVEYYLDAFCKERTNRDRLAAFLADLRDRILDYGVEIPQRYLNEVIERANAAEGVDCEFSCGDVPVPVVLRAIDSICDLLAKGTGKTQIFKEENS